MDKQTDVKLSASKETHPDPTRVTESVNDEPATTPAEDEEEK